MTLRPVSDQGFTVHNHMCGINFLSHLRGAPQKPTPNWDDWNAVGWVTGEGAEIAEIDDIARHRRDRKGKTLPLMNTDGTDVH